jgi:hypothetical protein
MDTLFKSSSNFTSLSLKDLIEARDLFHFHLLNKKNVVATAVGLYRIRKHDPWPSHHNPHPRPPQGKRGRRTLSNSEVRPYSWPCVYVFVSDWKYESHLADTDPSDIVPKNLFLSDGRSVPVCVIEARKQNFAKDLQVRADSRVPRNLLGPGSAIINKDGQGMERLGTAGCIVRDGEGYYVLTNRHVVGAPGTPISALQGHREPEIGVSAHKSLTRKDFRSVYPHFQSTEQHLLMDVGLVAVDDILAWKTDVPGIAPLGPVLDLYDNSFSLKLLTMKVVGQSAVSGMIRGEIHALFYRYKAMGGSEYVSDFLIGPETEDEKAGLKTHEGIEKSHPDAERSLGVHHGDSGTVLFIEHVQHPEYERSKTKATTIYYPFALLWGKEEFFDGNKLLSHPYALATSLSTALNVLDLDYVRDINLDQEYIWGWTGHYVIGRALTLPTDLLKSKKLQGFITDNIDLLAIEPDAALDNDPKVLTQGSSKPNFVPLADVPDNVWKGNVNFTMVDGGEGQKKKHKPGPGSRGSADNKNHFADLDMEYRNGKTFLELNYEDPDAYLNPPAWMKYFEEVEPQFLEWQKLLQQPKKKTEPKDGSSHWGALPFRVHQIFDIMVDAAKKKNAKLFLCAGGVLIHYMGDACQPLHASYLSNGDPASVVPRPKSEGNKMEADGVHVGYEDDMIAYGYTEKNLAKEIKTRIASLKDESILDINTGHDAAKAVIALIHATQKEIAPRAIVDKWVTLLGKHKKDRAGAMWEKFGDATITCMARGTRYLAKVWQSAWDVGRGDQNIGKGPVITEQAIMDLYNDPGVIPSVGLNHYPNVNSDWSGITLVPPQQPTVSPSSSAPKSASPRRSASRLARSSTPAKTKSRKPAKKKLRKRA